MFKSIIQKIVNARIEKLRKKHEAKKAVYRAMSRAEFRALGDDELYDAALARVEAIVETMPHIIDGIGLLGDAAKTFYIVAYSDYGDIFTEEGFSIAPMLSDCLAEVGAYEHQRLYDDFIAEHNIDIHDFTSFTEIGEAQIDAFYDRLCELAFRNNISDITVPYIRAHLEEF